MAFSPDFLEEIRARITLSSLVGRRVKLLRRGREHSGLCPFHNEKSPSFTVADDKGFFHCFGCGAHGDSIGFVMQSEGLSFPEAVERLAGEAGLEVPRQTPEEEARAEQRSSLFDVMEQAAAWYEANLAAPGGQEAGAYLRGRGLLPQTTAAFRLGFAPNRRGALRQALNGKGIDDEALIAVGLLKRPEDGGALRDYFFNRITFPIRDRRGRIIGFGGRAMGESKAKYLNSPETLLFHKGRVLFNLDKARKAAHDTGEVVVAEGYMDVIALAQEGFPAAVAPLGTAITEDQISELWRLAPEPVLCLDGDSAGRRAAYRAAERVLPLLQPGMSMKFAFLPDGEDPDSFLRGEGPQEMRRLLNGARPLVDVLWAKETEGRPSDTPERRAALRSAVRTAVGVIRDPELRQDYRSEMDQRYTAVFGPRPSQRGGQSGFSGPRAGHGAWGGSRGKAQPAMLRPRRKPEQLRRRQEQILLAVLINHPDLLAESAESIATLELSTPGLEGFRQALVDLISQDPGLDSEGLKCHLCDEGYSRDLAAVLDRDMYVHGKFARPDAAKDAARGGLEHVMALIRERQATRATQDVAREWAAEMNEDGLARLAATQKLNHEEEKRRTALDGDEGSERREPNPV